MTLLTSAEQRLNTAPVSGRCRTRLAVRAQSRQQRCSAVDSDRQNWSAQNRRALLSQLLVLPLAAQSKCWINPTPDAHRSVHNHMRVYPPRAIPLVLHPGRTAQRSLGLVQVPRQLGSSLCRLPSSRTSPKSSRTYGRRMRRGLARARRRSKTQTSCARCERSRMPTKTSETLLRYS